jgi:hypothetical protein
LAPSSGIWRPGRVADLSPPSNAEGAITRLPLFAFLACTGIALTLPNAREDVNSTVQFHNSL